MRAFSTFMLGTPQNVLVVASLPLFSTLSCVYLCRRAYHIAPTPVPSWAWVSGRCPDVSCECRLSPYRKKSSRFDPPWSSSQLGWALALPPLPAHPSWTGLAPGSKDCDGTVPISEKTGPTLGRALAQHDRQLPLPRLAKKAVDPSPAFL